MDNSTLALFLIQERLKKMKVKTPLTLFRGKTATFVPSKLFHPFQKCRSGEIGRRARLRIWYGDMCRFKSCLRHFIIIENTGGNYNS